MNKKTYITFILRISLSFFILLSLQSISAQPAPPTPVPPNASHITATILEYKVWPPGSLQDMMPSISSNEPIYSVKVEVYTSEPESSELLNMAVPGTVYEAFSSDVLTSDLVGKKIEATLKLTGDTRGVRWWISNVRLIK